MSMSHEHRNLPIQSLADSVKQLQGPNLESFFFSNENHSLGPNFLLIELDLMLTARRLTGATSVAQ